MLCDNNQTPSSNTSLPHGSVEHPYSPGVMLLDVLVVVVTAPLLCPLWVITPSPAQLTIQPPPSEEGASGADGKPRRELGGGGGGREVGVCCSSLWSCSRHSASLVWPRERAMDRGRRPRESGMASARRSHLYRTTAASRWPSAQAHIYTDRTRG